MTRCFTRPARRDVRVSVVGIGCEEEKPSDQRQALSFESCGTMAKRTSQHAGDGADQESRADETALTELDEILDRLICPRPSRPRAKQAKDDYRGGRKRGTTGQSAPSADQVEAKSGDSLVPLRTRSVAPVHDFQAITRLVSTVNVSKLTSFFTAWRAQQHQMAESA